MLKSTKVYFEGNIIPKSVSYGDGEIQRTDVTKSEKSISIDELGISYNTRYYVDYHYKLEKQSRKVSWEDKRRYNAFLGGTEGGAGGAGATSSATTRINVLDPHIVQMMRDVTGLNEARDAADPDQYSLVGVQKLAAANSNVATRHILQSSMFDN